MQALPEWGNACTARRLLDVASGHGDNQGKLVLACKVLGKGHSNSREAGICLV